MAYLLTSPTVQGICIEKPATETLSLYPGLPIEVVRGIGVSTEVKTMWWLLIPLAIVAILYGVLKLYEYCMLNLPR